MSEKLFIKIVPPKLSRGETQATLVIRKGRAHKESISNTLIPYPIAVPLLDCEAKRSDAAQLISVKIRTALQAEGVSEKEIGRRILKTQGEYADIVWKRNAVIYNKIGMNIRVLRMRDEDGKPILVIRIDHGENTKSIALSLAERIIPITDSETENLDALSQLFRTNESLFEHFSIIMHGTWNGRLKK